MSTAEQAGQIAAWPDNYKCQYSRINFSYCGKSIGWAAGNMVRSGLLLADRLRVGYYELHSSAID